MAFGAQPFERVLGLLILLAAGTLGGQLREGSIAARKVAEAIAG